VRSPFIARMIARLIGSPSPAPYPKSARLPRANFSKTVATSSRVMPPPLSMISISIAPSRAWVLTVIFGASDDVVADVGRHLAFRCHNLYAWPEVPHYTAAICHGPIVESHTCINVPGIRQLDRFDNDGLLAQSRHPCPPLIDGYRAALGLGSSKCQQSVKARSPTKTTNSE
jgi:hypothetical protein